MSYHDDPDDGYEDDWDGGKCDDECEGCAFPDKCIMGGVHLRSECCTAEMMADFMGCSDDL